ncbi:MAG: methenyltetrahydrofolate cyclohydrolase [Gammaproteobacteria bacterium]
MFKDLPVHAFLDALASKAPTPGGGSAAAIMGAMAAALSAMVCNLTIGKEKFAEVEPDMRAALEHGERLRARLLEMVNEDVAAFDAVMAAYALPRQTDDEKAARTAAVQAALRTATDVPLACVRACAELIGVIRAVAEKGNKGVISDAGVAVLAAQAALRSAALNVYINVGSINDREFAASRMAELEHLLVESGPLCESIYQRVRERL